MFRLYWIKKTHSQFNHCMRVDSRPKRVVGGLFPNALILSDPCQAQIPHVLGSLFSTTITFATQLVTYVRSYLCISYNL